MLSNFFRINMPYGIAVYEDNTVIAFNREYAPLGFYNERMGFENLRINTLFPCKYTLKSINLLIDQLGISSGAIKSEEKGLSFKSYLFYNDASNPSVYGSRLITKASKKEAIERSNLWTNYFDKIKLLDFLVIQ